MSNLHNELARDLAKVCLAAAGPVMSVYASDFTPAQKEDRSPVTEADRLAEAIILELLGKHFPDIPVLAEESFSEGDRPSLGGKFFLVDPVDGTKEFIKKNNEFTINVALVRNRNPVAGCVFAPALARIYLGGDTAFAANAHTGQTFEGLLLEPICVRTPPAKGKTAVMSRSHADEMTKAFAEGQGVVDIVTAGSSLKFCKVAEGLADLYPRFGPTMEWDTAAGHAVLSAAGGWVTNPDGTPFRYAKTERDYLNGSFVAWGYPPAV